MIRQPIPDRTQLRASVRERVKAESKYLAKLYGIPKAFVAHARRHGQQVVDIIQTYAKNRDALPLRGKGRA